MPLTKLPFAPGFHKEGTQYTVGPSWWDGDKIRFRKGLPEQIGGWAKYNVSSYMGVARSLFDWSTAESRQYLGVGTTLKMYVEVGGSYYDITPIRATNALTDPFAAVNGDATITVTDVAHGAVLGDFVTYSGATGLGGAITATVLNQEYEIASIVTADVYTIEAKDTAGDPVLATAGDTTAGGAVTAAYQINVGTNAFSAGGGWGSLGWGISPWGGGGALTFAGQLRLHSQDAFGDDLVFNPRIGNIYFWDESAAFAASYDYRAVALEDLAGALAPPVAALQVMVSPVDRHVIAFGCNPIGSTAIDPLLVRWGDQESVLDWTPTAINTAGGQVLATGTSFVGAVKTRQEILIFTDTAIHAMRFSGAPYVFRFSVVGENVSICSPKAAISAGDMVFFMDLEGFYIYKGAVTRLPCEVLDHVFSNLDKTQAYKVFATNNPDDSEVTWFYPVGESPAEITNYVTYNYAEQVWTTGTFQRGAWIQAASRAYPISSTNDITTQDINYLYNQEIGFIGDDGDIGGWIESGMVEIGDGDHLSFASRFVPDFRLNGSSGNASFNITIKGTNFPMSTMTTRVEKTVTSLTTQSHIRVRAREIAIKIESSGNDYGWTMGDFRFQLRPDGRR
jgi:hypothetical protein